MMLKASKLLQDAWRRFSERWATTKDKWQDQKAREFEKDYWSALEQATVRAIRELQDEEQRLTRIESKLR